jgi:hypothetical protein
MDINIKNVKICVTIPRDYTDKVREAICNAGAGTTFGNYSDCSNITKTIGTFKPINNATMNINDSSKLLVNANEYDGERLKRTISNNVLNVEYIMEEVKIEEPEEIEPIIEEKKENNCLLGVEFCCKEFRGISYCILAGIGLVLIILIFAIIHLIIDRADDKKYKDF